MPLSMDRHHIEGIEWKDVQLALEQDLKIQGKYDAHFLTYWFDEGRHTTFCLVSAPSAEAVTGLHSEAHGQIPNEVVEVEQTAVLSLMGRIADIPFGKGHDGRAIDRGFRSIMFTDLVGYTAMTNRPGDDRALKILRDHNNVVRDALARFGGREVKHTGDGVMASFDEADQALRSAIKIRGDVADIEMPDQDSKLIIRIGLTSGEHIQEGEDLFGSVVNLASRLCDLAEANEILFSHEFQGELTDDSFAIESIGEVTVRGFDRPVHVARVIG